MYKLTFSKIVQIEVLIGQKKEDESPIQISVYSIKMQNIVVEIYLFQL